jgi:hypothetical protein
MVAAPLFLLVETFYSKIQSIVELFTAYPSEIKYSFFLDLVVGAT